MNNSSINLRKGCNASKQLPNLEVKISLKKLFNLDLKIINKKPHRL